MANPEDKSKKEAIEESKSSKPREERGKKVIKAGKQLNKQDKSAQQKEEKKDAEQ